MSQVKVVPEATPDPKLGKERSVSGFNVPYFDLSDSIDVARVVREHGGRVNREQLAGLLKYASTISGTFKTRVSAAKGFGLIEQPEANSDVIAVTARGIAIVAPVSDAESLQAKIDAFMEIPLFKLMYEEYKGRELPADVGLANLFEHTHKMLKSRALPAVKVMIASADTAGLFRIHGAASRKMVLPIMPSGGSPKPPHPRTPTTTTPDDSASTRNGGDGGGSGNGGSGGGGGEDLTGIDPALVALLRRLPKAGTELSRQRRDRLIAAFTAAIDWIYPSPEAENVF